MSSRRNLSNRRSAKAAHHRPVTQFTAPTTIATRRNTALSRLESQYSLCPTCNKARKFCACPATVTDKPSSVLG